ncbi:uncharacterized protein METZ01_LOCUS226199 [marine metagenome]|uniref:Uncharacterized protein n=1 Tax=marine metagenome TaxID=408172 RepID=A0A382GF39_9ZZZZ
MMKLTLYTQLYTHLLNMCVDEER